MPDNEVKVRITGENDASPAIQQAQRALDGLAEAGERVQSALEALGVSEIVSRLAELTSRAAETGANLAEMAERTGVSAGELQGLSYAAQRTGVSTEQLEKGIGRLQNTILKAAEGNKQAKATLDAFGISARNADGTLTSASVALGKVADKMAATKDGTEKAALTQQAFGRGMTALIPMLNEGSAGLADLTSRAALLGQNFTNLDINALRRLHVDMVELQTVSTSLAERFAAGLAPSLDAVAQGLIGLDGKFDAASEAGSRFGKMLENIAWPGNQVGTGLAYLWGTLTEWSPDAWKEKMDSITQQADAFDWSLSQGAKKLFAFQGNPAIQRAVEAYSGELKKLDAEYKGGVLSAAAYAAAADKATKAYADAVKAGQKDPFANKPTGNLPVPDLSKDKEKDYSRELLEFQIEAIKAGLTALKAGNQAEAKENEELYKHNLITVEAYYAKKKSIAEDEIRIEMLALEQEGKLYGAALGKLVDLNSAEGKRLQTMIASGKVDDQTLAKMPKIKDNLSEILQLMTKEMQTATQLDTLQKKLNETQGLTPSGQVDSLARLADSEDIAAAKAKLLGDTIQATFDKIKDQTDLVKQKMEDFVIGGSEGQKELNAVLKQGSDQLKTMIADYQKLAAAAGDPKLVTEGQKFETQLDQMDLKVHTLAQTLAQEGQKNIENFLGAIEKAPNAAKAFEDFGMSILEMLSKIINQMIATWIIEKAIGIGGGAAGGGGAISIGSDINAAPTNAAGVPGTVPRFAEGGEPPVGEPALVGEEGPELFIPHTAGAVIPHEETMQRLMAGMPQQGNPEVMDDFMARLSHMSMALDHNADDLVGRLQTSAPGIVSRLDPSGLFGAHAIPHALGGDMDPGDVGLVGEAGPELFVPDAAGHVIPNNLVGDALSGGGGGDVHMHQNFDFRGADANSERRIHRMMQQWADVVQAKTEMSIMQKRARRTRG